MHKASDSSVYATADRKLSLQQVIKLRSIAARRSFHLMRKVVKRKRNWKLIMQERSWASSAGQALSSITNYSLTNDRFCDCVHLINFLCLSKRNKFTVMSFGWWVNFFHANMCLSVDEHRLYLKLNWSENFFMLFVRFFVKRTAGIKQYQSH